MSLNVACVFEVRVTGNDNNGGAFNVATAGTDRSFQDSPQVVINNSTITCTTPGANSNTLTFTAGYTPSSADIGNVVQILTGTNINAGFYEITGQTSSTWTVTGAANLTTAGGAGSAITGNMGGALATPGKAFSGVIGGNDVYLKAGTYTLTSTTSNIAGGRITVTAGASNPDPTRLIGYNAARGDNGTKPVVKAGVGQTSFSLITTAANSMVDNVEVDGSGNATVTGINVNAASSSAYRCRARSCTNFGIQCQGADRIVAFCEAVSCGEGILISNDAYCYACEAHACTTAGFEIQNCTCVSCIAYANTTASAIGFRGGTTALKTLMVNCTAYGNNSNGFYLNASPALMLLVNCVATGNGAAGFNCDTVNSCLWLENCAGYNNTGGNTTNMGRSEGFITLTGDPFTNAGAGDFSINNTAGAGAALREAGVPGVFPGGTTTSYPDVGAAQAHVAAGSTVAKGIPTIASIRH